MAMAWPVEGILTLLPTDIPIFPVAIVKADDAGYYSITLDPETIPEGYMDQDGRVDLELRVTDGEDQITWGLTIFRVPGADPAAGQAVWAANPEQLDEGPQDAEDVEARHVVLDLEEGAATDSIFAEDPNATLDEVSGLEPMETAVVEAESDYAVLADVAAETDPVADQVGVGGVPGSPATGAAVLLPAKAVLDRAERMHGSALCGTSKGSLVTGVSEKFLVMQGATGAKATVTQTVSTKHTLGLVAAFTSGSKVVKVTAGGTKTVTTAMSATSGSYTDARTVYNKVNYRIYLSDCNPTVRDYRPESFHSLLSSLNWTTSKTPTSTEKSKNCTLYSNGSMTKIQGSNIEYSSGVTIKAGVTASAKASFTKEVSVTWKFTKKTWLCGSTSSGPVASPWTYAAVY
ncbi:MAG: hypothetical protein LBR19_05380 [Bifidobacteriaceae bacterium]|nr:hypothetical protein [Bifidobacteriaceae bacterium]